MGRLLRGHAAPLIAVAGVLVLLAGGMLIGRSNVEDDALRPVEALTPEAFDRLLDESRDTQADGQRGRTVGGLGLTRQQRMAIYRRLVSAEDRGQAEADRVFPIEDAVTRADFTQHFELVDQLQERYRQELASELGITRDQLRGIGNEGARQNWPMPTPPR